MHSSFLFLSIFFSLSLSSNNKQDSFIDISIPPPTTPTGTAPYPSERPPKQTWPTDPIPWPPTMSPYPTKVPHTIPSKYKLSSGAIAGIVIGCVGFVSIVVSVAIFYVKKNSNYNIAGLNDSSLLLSDKVE